MNTQIEWYELHDELPQVASVIKKYKEMYTDEVLRNLFTRNDINRLNEYMSTHDIDDEHLKNVFKDCQGWISSQMSYDHGRCSYDLFIQDICHNQPAVFEELCELSGGHKEYKDNIAERISKLNDYDDIHDFGGSILSEIDYASDVGDLTNSEYKELKNLYSKKYSEILGTLVPVV